MRTYITTLLLVGCIATGLTLAPAAHAATVTNQDLDRQETVVRDKATDTIDAYLRLILYTVIYRLETGTH